MLKCETRSKRVKRLFYSWLLDAYFDQNWPLVGHILRTRTTCLDLCSALDGGRSIAIDQRESASTKELGVGISGRGQMAGPVHARLLFIFFFDQLELKSAALHACILYTWFGRGGGSRPAAGCLAARTEIILGEI